MTRKRFLICVVLLFLGIPSSVSSVALATFSPDSNLPSEASVVRCTCGPDCPICHGHEHGDQMCCCAMASRQNSKASASSQARAGDTGPAKPCFQKRCGGPNGDISLPSSQEGVIVQFLDGIELPSAQLEQTPSLLSPSFYIYTPDKPPTFA